MTMRQLSRAQVFFLILVGLMIGDIPRMVSGQEKKPAPAPVNYRKPAREYELTRLGDFSVMLEKQLRTDDPEVAKAALARLERKLPEAMRLLPKSSHERLKKLKIIVMYGPKAKGGGQDGGLGYVRKKPPDVDEFDPRWASGIVIYRADQYAKIPDFWALKVLLHELAHAHHLEQWADDQEDILNAYKKAMKQGLYHNVKDDQGKKLEKAYAADNQLEYFAELSCMYFGKCNYHPFDRKELKDYDPEGYAMIEKMWGINVEK